MLQQFRASCCENSYPDLHFMIQAWMVQHSHYGLNRSSFGIVSPVNQALNSRVNQRARAHRTRLNCSKEVTTSQAVIAKRHSSFTKRENFGMGAGIVAGNNAIPTAPDDPPCMDYDRAYRHLAYFQGALGAAQCLFHP
jgi:hypothetical protein